MRVYRRRGLRHAAVVPLLLLSVIGRAEPENSPILEDPPELLQAWAEYTASYQSDDQNRQVAAAQAVTIVAEESLPASDPRQSLFLINYGKALLQSQQTDEAKEVLERALGLAEQVHGADSPKLLAVLPLLADASSDPSNEQSQIAVYRRALKIAESASGSGKSSEIYARIALRTAVNSYSLSRTLKGLGYLKEAHAYFESRFGEDAYDTGVSLYYLGKFAFSDGNFKKSINYLLSSLPGLEQRQTADALDLQRFARTLLARCYHQTKEVDLATEQYVEIGRLNESRQDEDYLPLLRVAPAYPAKMLSGRNEGFVDLEFTVDESGFPTDVVVIGRGDDDRGFEKAAISAVKQFRYAPRFVDGQPIAVAGVKTRISFRLER